MIKDILDDTELEQLYNSKLDLYKWKCIVPNCQHYTKVWKLAGEQSNSFAWLRAGVNKWIHKYYHYFMCAKHFKLYKQKKLIIDRNYIPGCFMLLKQNVMKRKRYTLIQKINA